MPRRYYRRTRVVRPKKKWASGIKTINYTIRPDATNVQTRIPWTPLVTNSVQSSAPTPVIVKAGNFKVNADVHIVVNAPPEGSTNVLHFVAFVVFLPEGIAPADNTQFGTLITAHPEYIIGWRQIDAEMMDMGSQGKLLNTQRVTFSSRLKRNLNSGDQIVFGILDQSSQLAAAIVVSLTCQYWTCSN